MPCSSFAQPANMNRNDTLVACAVKLSIREIAGYA